MLALARLQPSASVGDHEAVAARWLVVALNGAVLLLPLLPFLPRKHALRSCLHALQHPQPPPPPAPSADAS
eukprot:1237188-Rhodomonas_salina.1